MMEDEDVIVVFRNIPANPTLEASIRRKADRLFRIFWHIESCRITLSLPDTNSNKTARCQAQVELVVPGFEIVAGRHPTLVGSHENPYLAVRDAFKSAKRLVKEYAKQQRERNKRHEWGRNYESNTAPRKPTPTPSAVPG